MQAFNVKLRLVAKVAIIALVAGVSLLPALVQGQSGMYVYPGKGQTPEQQSKDQYECHAWAVQQTGFDPSQANPGNPNYLDPQAQPSKGQVLRGAGRGAALGAIGGAIAGDAGKGAAAGAAVGGAAGTLRRRDQKKQQAAAQQQAAQAQASQADAYKRAIATCLQGRGYTVN